MVLRHSGSVLGLSLNEKARLLVTSCADSYFRLWNLDTGACLFSNVVSLRTQLSLSARTLDFMEGKHE
jgi:WD40 repeat protein